MLILVQLFQIYKCILVLCNAIVDEPTISHAEEVPPTDHSITFSMTMHYPNLNITKKVAQGYLIPVGITDDWPPYMEDRSAETVAFVNLLAVSH